jgi:hypothetical protein
MRNQLLPVIAVCAAVLAVGGALPASAQLYKHVDADGKVTYTDVPLTSEEKQLQISNTARNGDGGAKLAKKKAAAPNAKGDAKGGGGNKRGGGQKKVPAKRADPESQQ